MTDDSIALRELLEKSADADLLREMIGFAAERLMELKVQGPDRRRLWRAHRGAAGAPQRLPRPGLGDPCRRRHAPETPTSRDRSDCHGSHGQQSSLMALLRPPSLPRPGQAVARGGPCHQVGCPARPLHDPGNHRTNRDDLTLMLPAVAA